MDLTALNGWAIAAATALAFVMGGLWYRPLFGKAWMAALGKTADELDPSPAPYIISFFTALLTAVVLAALIQALGITGWVDGVRLGLATGVGFIATAMASDSAFCGRGVRLFLIQAGYRVAYSVVMGALLSAWP